MPHRKVLFPIPFPLEKPGIKNASSNTQAIKKNYDQDPPLKKKQPKEKQQKKELNKNKI
jgi:hypothetical protein